MSQHNAAIMTVLCPVIAAKLIGDGITSQWHGSLLRHGQICRPSVLSWEFG